MIYNIYKPKDFSSFSIVKQVKRITREKVGHSGTLDPFADGVLVLGIGKSTKKTVRYNTI
jgi:tRNA pseudouridine55 synthase